MTWVNYRSLSSQLIDRATSPPDYDEDDMKAKQKSLEESWQEQSLIEAVLKPHPVVHREDLEEPLLSPATSMAVPGEGEQHRRVLVLLGHKI